MKKKYNTIISLGADCAAASYMKKQALRTISSPFDWLTHASFQSRMELIINDFENFLNYKDLKFLEKDPSMFNDEDCDYYENTKNGFYYFHDFKKNIPLEQSFPEVKEKYNRRIARFLNILNSNKEILLVYLTHQSINDDELIKIYCQKIKEKFSAKIDFLIIEHKENMQVGEIEELKFDKSIYKFNLYTLATSKEQNQTLGQEKYIKQIFKQFALKNPFIKIKRMIVNIICALIPNKNLRKKIRKITKAE